VLAGITALKVERRERRRGALDCVSIGFHKLIYFGNCILWARRNEWGEHPIRFKRPKPDRPRPRPRSRNRHRERRFAAP
jgi:hypothetical protein